jgi:hypothetical protein
LTRRGTTFSLSGERRERSEVSQMMSHVVVPCVEVCGGYGTTAISIFDNHNSPRLAITTRRSEAAVIEN